MGHWKSKFGNHCSRTTFKALTAVRWNTAAEQNWQPTECHPSGNQWLSGTVLHLFLELGAKEFKTEEKTSVFGGGGGNETKKTAPQIKAKHIQQWQLNRRLTPESGHIAQETACRKVACYIPRTVNKSLSRRKTQRAVSPFQKKLNLNPHKQMGQENQNGDGALDDSLSCQLVSDLKTRLCWQHLFLFVWFLCVCVCVCVCVSESERGGNSLGNCIQREETRSLWC